MPADIARLGNPDIETLLAPPFATRVAQQFFTHSAHAPVTILILEWLLSGNQYFSKPDAYILIAAALSQSVWAAHENSPEPLHIALGNLVGALVYSFAESLLEGPQFFSQPQHVAYWGIALSFALLQGLRAGAAEHPAMRKVLLLAENVVRAAIPVLLYGIFESRSVTDPAAVEPFFDDAAHVYLAIVVLMLGLLLGFADLTLQRTQQALCVLAGRLHELSSWSFGSRVVAAALQDAGQVALRRQERGLLFMDIRGFTAWSEEQTPEAIVTMLNDYYVASEAVLQPLAPIKVKFTADEVMAVFADKKQAFAAAQHLQQRVRRVLDRYGLSVGIGLHAGQVVEGMLGSSSVKAYEVIGDAVNTAARLCSAAGAGELLVSSAALPGVSLAQFPLRQVEAKGKSDPLAVRVLAFNHAPITR